MEQNKRTEKIMFIIFWCCLALSMIFTIFTKSYFNIMGQKNMLCFGVSIALIIFGIILLSTDIKNLIFKKIKINKYLVIKFISIILLDSFLLEVVKKLKAGTNVILDFVSYINTSEVRRAPMAFTSLNFIFLFFPITVILYYVLINNKLRNIFLVIASLIFYSTGEPRVVWLLVISIVVNYLFALALGKEWEFAPIKKCFLYGMFLWNAGLLIYYKYLYFVVENINHITGTHFVLTDIIQPLGISFFTFRTISFCLDVYWGTVPIQTNFINVALYISFFPQLTMGPISKYNDFSKQLDERKFNLEIFLDGIKRIIVGMFKKLVISDTIGLIVDTIFGMGSERTALLAWMGILGYLIQLYYDFSGYSDIAVGLGQLFGFKTPENFDYPYVSKTITEYWSRWHITLGTWMKNYLYTPIFRACQDKNIKKMGCDILALLGVWVFAGIWHGTGWNYLLYGLYYCLFIVLERLWENYKKKKRKKLGIKKQPETVPQKIRSHIYFFIVLVFGQLMFRSDNLTMFGKYFLDMFGLRGNGFGSQMTLFYWKQMAVVFILGLIFSFPVVPKIQEFLGKGKRKIILDIATPVVYAILLVVAIAFAFTSTYQAFVYFQF